MKTLTIDTSIPSVDPNDNADWTASKLVIGHTQLIDNVEFSKQTILSLSDVPKEILPYLQAGIGFFASLNAGWRVKQCYVTPTVKLELDEDENIVSTTPSFNFILALIDKETKSANANQVVSLDDKPDLLLATKAVWDWVQSLDL